MGKRSNFERVDKDYYRTFDPRAYPPLLRFLPRASKFIEPCAGEGDMVRALEGHGHECVYASDIEPKEATGLFSSTICARDALEYTRPEDVAYNRYEIVSNPPWKRKWLHLLIDHLRQQHRTWLLFDADWAFTVQERIARDHGVRTVPELMRHCSMIIAVGRLQWIEGSDHAAQDSVAWYCFDDQIHPHTQFYPKEGSV